MDIWSDEPDVDVEFSQFMVTAVPSHSGEIHVKAWLGWTIFGVIALAVIVFSFGFVWYYKMRNEPSSITKMVGVSAIIFTLLSLFLIPADVYLSSSDKFSSDYRNDIKYVYYAFDLIFMFFLFIGLPFAYFYYEELGDLEDRTNTVGKRVAAALKYTIGFTIVWIVLVIIGMFIDFSSNAAEDSDSAWTHTVTDRFSSHTSNIVPFCMAVLMCIGLFFSMVYTSWGLAGFPVALMKSIHIERAPDTDKMTVELDLVSRDLDILRTKYAGKDRIEWRQSDAIREKHLTKKKNVLRRKLSMSQGPNQRYSESANYRNSRPQPPPPRRSSDDCCGRCMARLWNASAPVRYLVGLILLAFSLLIVVSIAMHLVDQIINSDCGYSCGFALENRTYANPVGWTLRRCSEVFPVDYIVFSVVIFYLFWCTVVGLAQIDVRFLCFKLFSLRPHETMHNALMMAIGFVVLVVSSFTYMSMNLAPDYVMYGNQGPNCDLDSCNATQVYYFLSGIMIGMPIFGLIYFVLSCIFVLVFCVGVVVNLCRSVKKKDQKLLADEDEDLEAIFRQ